MDFMVSPDFLATRCYVPASVKVRIVDPKRIFLLGVLGESGRRMVKAGAPFLFTRSIAEDLIARGIARRMR